MFARRFIPLLVAATLISLGLAASTRPVAAASLPSPRFRAALGDRAQARGGAVAGARRRRRARARPRRLRRVRDSPRAARAAAHRRLPALRAVAGEAGAVLADLAPAEPGYRRLQDALASYRRIAAGGGWGQVPDTAKLKHDDRGAAVTALRRRLAAEGLLPADALAGGFDAAVEAAVRRFQARHGIAADGAVGPDTFGALNVPAAARVEQIRANLERWRELPRSWPKTRIEVNVPAATLTVIEGGEPRLVMRAIVGAEDHPTPVMRAHMSAVLFNPAWTIPASIAKNEILPKARRDPKYLERNHYVYRGASLQQLPGAGNALGRVKFEMPNIYDIYLHDTPSRPLFRRVSRSLSHGCVRLENPRELALYLLSGRSGWAEGDIDRVIAPDQTASDCCHSD